MPMKMARELCSEETVIKGNAATYSKVSDEITEIIKKGVPVFEKSSIIDFLKHKGSQKLNLIFL